MFAMLDVFRPIFTKFVHFDSNFPEIQQKSVKDFQKSADYISFQSELAKGEVQNVRDYLFLIFGGLGYLVLIQK